MHISELFDWSAHTSNECQKANNYQFVPDLRTAKLVTDETLRIPERKLPEEEKGKRGRKTGSKPKDKRKTAKPGSLANPSIAVT
ncbi:hypothetical protein PI125_g21505 [Phytophthora idaei]|nr:hypothetical protein PI125_g21505 [Phytophthora idaei]